MANFIGLVYATLKNEGVDTKGMSTDEAVAKFKELQKKSGGNGTGEKEATPAEQRKLEQKGVVDKGKRAGEYKFYETSKRVSQANKLSDSDKEIVNEAIYWAKKNGDASVKAVFEQLEQDMAGFLSYGSNGNYDAVRDYISEQVFDKKDKADTFESNDIDYENVNYPKGTNKEYTQSVNTKYEKALPILEKAGIKLSEFTGGKSKEGGYDSNAMEIAEKYVFEPFNKKYPNGNNEAWNKEFEPLYLAINAVLDKNYNDFYIKNNN